MITTYSQHIGRILTRLAFLSNSQSFRYSICCNHSLYIPSSSNWSKLVFPRPINCEVVYFCVDLHISNINMPFLATKTRKSNISEPAWNQFCPQSKIHWNGLNRLPHQKLRFHVQQGSLMSDDVLCSRYYRMHVPVQPQNYS